MKYANDAQAEFFQRGADEPLPVGQPAAGSRIIFEPDGSGRFIYDDATAEVAGAAGCVVTRRASHVEPAAEGGWAADLSPVGGPLLGPYRTRAEALDAEVRWLWEHDVPLPKEVQCQSRG